MKDLGHRGYHHRCRQLLVGFLAHPRSSRITNVHSGEPRSTSELFTIPFLYLGEHTEESHWDIPPTVASNPRTLPSNFCKMRQPPFPDSVSSCLLTTHDVSGSGGQTRAGGSVVRALCALTPEMKTQPCSVLVCGAHL